MVQRDMSNATTGRVLAAQNQGVAPHVKRRRYGVDLSHHLGHSREEFYPPLSEARKGKLNPWWDMLRRMAHHSHGPDVTKVVTSAKPDFDLVDHAFNLFL